MRSLALFKGAKGDHKMYTMYYNPNANDQYKGYLMLNFANTKVSQTVWGKTVGNFENAIKTNFGINLASSIDELGTFMRFLAKDPTVFKDEHKTKDGKGYSISLLHKQGDSDKCLYLWQRATGGYYLGIHDRKIDFKVNLSLSSSEMYVMQLYAQQVLYHFRQEDVRENDDMKSDTPPAATVPQATMADVADDLPF